MTKLSARDYWLLLATCVLALVLRLWKLDASLWYDEVLTLTQFVRLPVMKIVTTYSSLNNHVFYSLQAHAIIALFGESAWALRLPAVMLGVGAVPVVFVLVRRIGAPTSWAHVTSILLAASYHHIWFSQNARGYSGLVFWCLLASITFLCGCRQRSAGPWIWFSIFSALALYTHLSAAFFIVSLGIIYAGTVPFALHRPSFQTIGLVSRWPLIAVLLTLSLSAVLYAPMIPQMVTAFGKVTTPNVVSIVDAVPAWRSPLWTLSEMLSSAPLPWPVTLALLPALVVTLGLGFLAVWRLDRSMALIVPTSIVITMLILTCAGMRLWPRYLLIELPFLLLFATAGTAGLAAWIARWTKNKRLLTVIGWSFGILASLIWASRNYIAPKQDFLGAVALVEAESQPADIHASFGLASLPLSTFFAPDWVILDTMRDLDAVLAANHPVWLVYAFEDHSLGTYPELMARIDSTFTEVASLPGTLGGGYVHILRSNSAND